MVASNSWEANGPRRTSLGSAVLNDSTKADEASSPFGTPGAKIRIPPITSAPTSWTRPGTTSSSLPHAVSGSQPKLEPSADPRFRRVSGSTISTTASGESLVISLTWPEYADESEKSLDDESSGGGAITTCPPTVPS